MRRILSILILALALATSSAVGAAAAPVADLSASVPTAQVKVVQGGVELSVADDAAETFHIYSITGQMIKAVDLQQGTRQVELPRGCYIIKCSKWSKKVVVK